MEQVTGRKGRKVRQSLGLTDWEAMAWGVMGTGETRSCWSAGHQLRCGGGRTLSGLGQLPAASAHPELVKEHKVGAGGRGRRPQQHLHHSTGQRMLNTHTSHCEQSPLNVGLPSRARKMSARPYEGCPLLPRTLRLVPGPSRCCCISFSRRAPLAGSSWVRKDMAKPSHRERCRAACKRQ